MTNPAIVDTLISSWHDLSALGATLTADEWETPTDLPRWTVKDNLSHLIGIERMLQGLPATTHRAAALDHVRNAIGEMNEHEVDARRAVSGADVFREWDELVALRVQTLRDGDDAYYAQPMINPTGPGTLTDFLHVRVLDCWLHEQDMRRAVGRQGNLSGPAAEHTVDRLLRTVPIVVGKRAATPESGAVELDISGGVQRHLVCEVSEGRAAIVAEPSSAPLATITLDTEAFIVLATGRRTLDQVTAEITGDRALAGRVLGQFNMMI